MTGKATVFSVRAPKIISKNEVFTLKTKTTTNTSKIGVFYEYGKPLGKISQTYVDKDGIHEWIIAIKIGSKGERTFEIKACCNEIWSESKQFNIKVQ